MVGSSLSVLDNAIIGASLSLRSFVRFGSALALFDHIRVGSSLAVLDGVCLGASLSLRSYSLLGSSLSVMGNLRFGSSLSVLDFTHIGSSLSLRSFSRFGASLSIFANMHINGDLKGLNTILGKASTGDLTKRISLPQGAAATLHGTWYNELGVSTSDRRLKQNIAPLQAQLHKRREEVLGANSKDESAVSWVLRELRPVSFRFKQTSDAKSLAQNQRQRYGFVAQEMERVAPNLVYGSEADGESTGQSTMALLYQDLLAVLTLAFKEQQQEIQRQDNDVVQAQMEVTELLDAADMLEKVLDTFEASGGASAMHS